MSENTVKKSVTVRADIEHAFRVFTEGFDSWWPRAHHIGTSPMKRAIIEGRAHGRCYTEQEDGSECDWGKVLVWEPPARLVVAWQVTPEWKYEPDLERSSEVEIRFTKIATGTRVDLEHRHFERHGAGGASMREAVGTQSGGWGGLLDLYAQEANRSAA